HAALPELLEQALGDLERAAEHADVLAHQQHALVAAHLLAQRLAQRLAIAHLAHVLASSPRASASEICCGISSASADAVSAWRAVTGCATGSVVITEYVPLSVP